MTARQNADASAPSSVSSAEVGRLLASDPAAAEARTREILKTKPGNADALLVLGAALRRQGRAVEAKATIEPIAAAQPDSAFAQVELGLALAQLGQRAGAIEAFARAVDVAPTYVNAWFALADELAPPGSGAEENSPRDGKAFHAVDLAVAKKNFGEAEALLARILEAGPDREAARVRYAAVLMAGEKAHLALSEIEQLIRADPANVFYRELKASTLQEMGEFHRAIVQYEELLSDGRERPGGWLSYGRALRAIGRQKESIAAFRKAVKILPAFAQGWRMLASIKTMRFSPEAVGRLEELLARPGLLISTRMQLHFALAKALEDAGRYGESFEHYTRSQVLQGTGVAGSAARFRDFVGLLKTVFTPEFFRARPGVGSDQDDPVFVVGMPRAGSTLVQEILAAHSAIERTGELHDLSLIVNRLQMEAKRAGVPLFPKLLGSLARERFQEMGAEYLERTRPRRKARKRLFVDKHPENFVNAGFIHLILPHAKIIDVRRHPVDCCFSIFRNYFPAAPPWSHDLEELGCFYAGYVELMAHWDEVLPGRVHRIVYEELVADPAKEVRRMLDYLGLPFEEACLRFFEKEQAIATTSVEQARRPIYTGGVGNSASFEPWLGPLKQALGRVLDAYPTVPEFPPATFRASYSMRIA